MRLNGLATVEGKITKRCEKIDFDFKLGEKKRVKQRQFVAPPVFQTGWEWRGEGGVSRSRLVRIRSHDPPPHTTCLNSPPS